MVATAEAEAERSEASDAKPRGRGRPRKNPPKEKKTDRVMSDDHKVKIAETRELGRIVSRYLDGLAVTKPKRGRKVTPEALQEKLEKIEYDLPTAKPIDRLNLLQLQKDILQQLEEKAPEVDMEALEKEFVRVGKNYAHKKKIARSTFLEVGVPAEVLKAAGI